MMQKVSKAALILALVLVASGSLPAVDNGRTFLAPQSNLMWVADANYLVSSGLSSVAALPLAEAQRLVWAMNAGSAENFGHRNWRLASAEELMELYQAYTSGKINVPIQNFGVFESWMAARAGGQRTGGWSRVPSRGDDRLFAWPVRAATSASQFEGLAVFATNSIALKRSVAVSGDIVANNVSPGPTIGPPIGFELSIDMDAVVNGDLKANRIKIFKKAVINGDVAFNAELINDGTINGTASGGLNLPVFDPNTLPPFQEGTLHPDVSDVIVGPGQTVVLSPGDYGDVTIDEAGTLQLTGGLYNVRSIDAVGDEASILFDAPSDVRILGKFRTRRFATIGPSAGSGVGAFEIIFYVDGIDGNDGVLGSTPEACRIGASSVVQANFYTRRGTLRVEADSSVTGAFFGRDVRLDSRAQVFLDSFFRNQPPVANPVDVETNGADFVIITLSGFDPEGGDLTFSIESGPTNGTLDPIMEIIPDPIPDPDNPGQFVQPPVSEATVVYRPTDPDANLADSFIYKVTDCEGAMGTATVTINPDDTSPPAPPLDAVTANDALVDVAQNVAKAIGLDAGGPPGVSLTFFVNSLPLEGSLSDSEGNAIESVPYDLPSQVVTYTPGQDFTGSDSFDFGARDSSTMLPCSSPSCDTATISIDVQPRPELAVDQSVGTDLNQPVQITLFANSGGTGSPAGMQPDFRLSRLSPIGGLKFALPGADIAGTVADEDLDGDGDATDNLPGSAPVLVAAAVDVNPHEGPASFDSEAALLGSVGNSVTYDFETASGFPSSGGNIGLFDGINFDAKTIASGQATSGAQGMTGSTGSFGSGTAVIDFTGLEAKPIAIGFFALDLTVIGNEVIRVTIDYTNAPSETFDVGLGGQPAFTPIYFGRVSAPFDSIESITLFGTEDSGGARAWHIDDLSLGFTGSTSSPRTWTLNEVTFEDGQSASGYFVFDAVSQTATDWNITTTAGTSFPLFTYTPANSTFSKFNLGNPTDTLFFQHDQSTRELRITPVTELSNQGGSVNLNLATANTGSGGVECFNCAPFRLIDGGSVSAPNFNGLEGTHRVQIEWNLSGLDIMSSDEIESAIVTLSTVKGSVDSLDTSFFAGAADQDGGLSPSDFEAAANAVPGVVMPVPAGSQTGDEGTFSFNATNQVKAAWDAGFFYFSIQARVDEGLIGTGFKRGLQVRSTASGNLTLGLEPKLDVLTAPVAGGTLWTVTVLPENGTLKTLSGEPVLAGTTFTSEPTLVYTPNLNFFGTDTVTYEVAEAGLVDEALITILVSSTDPCVLVGREPGCSPSGSE